MPKMKVVDGAITEYSLPPVGTLSDGRTVSNYHLLDEKTLAAEGWRDVVDQKPVYDKTTHDLVHDGYEVVDNTVRVKYRTEQKPPPPEPPIDPEIARQKFRDAVSAATTIAGLKAAILGNPTTDTPGAAPDLGRKP